MKKIFKAIVGFMQKNPYTSVLIVVAAILHFIVILPSGSHYCFNGYCGDYFWGVHEHDSIWHLAVANTSFKSFPPRSPIFAGSVLSGYNSLLDLILFLFSLIGISPIFLYFKILPVLWFVAFTYYALQLGKKIKKEKLFSFVFLFLCYFGASFSLFIPLVKAKTIVGTSSLLAMQAILTLTNIQLAFSYVILFIILILLYEKKLATKHILIFCLLLFIQWGLKFYAGFISSIIVGIVFLLRWAKDRNLKYLIHLLLISLSSVISVIVNYNPFQQSKNGFPFVFSPLASVWPLIEDPNMLYSSYWSNAKYVLLASSKVSPRLIGLIGVLIFLYIVLNLGPRIIGFVSLIKKIITKKGSDIDTGIFVGITCSLFFLLLVIQRGIWWNTVQFWFFIFLLLNIYTAKFIVEMKNKTISLAVIFFIIVLSIPYTIDALKNYAIYPGAINISDSEKSALDFLKKLPDGIIYGPPYKQNLLLNSKNNMPLYNHIDSSYISAYTNKPTYYADITQLLLLNSDYKKRKAQINRGDCSITSSVQYVYILASQTNDTFYTKCVINQKSFKKIYDRQAIAIYSKIK
jgi:hypothetical protein